MQCFCYLALSPSVLSEFSILRATSSAMSRRLLIWRWSIIDVMDSQMEICEPCLMRRVLLKVFVDIKGSWRCGEALWCSGSQSDSHLLSSTEAELIGYVDAITMGKSLQVVLSILQNNALVDDGDFLLKGDNLSGIQLLLSLDGPWRTRHSGPKC